MIDVLASKCHVIGRGCRIPSELHVGFKAKLPLSSAASLSSAAAYVAIIPRSCLVPTGTRSSINQLWGLQLLPPDWPTVRRPRAFYWHACFAMFRDTQADAQLSTSLNWPDGHQSGTLSGRCTLQRFLAFSLPTSVGWQRSHSSILP